MVGLEDFRRRGELGNHELGCVVEYNRYEFGVTAHGKSIGVEINSDHNINFLFIDTFDSFFHSFKHHLIRNLDVENVVGLLHCFHYLRLYVPEISGR